MIHELCDIRLGKSIHRCSLGEHIPNELMVPLAVAFLIAVHRIAIENPALYFSGFHITFDFDRVCKFAAPIREDHLEERRKTLVTKPTS